MRNYFLAATLLAILLVPLDSNRLQALPDNARFAPYVPGEILVKYRESASKNAILQSQSTLGGKTIREFPSLGVHHIRLKSGETVVEAIERYSTDPSVEYAEPNYIVHALATPNDPSFGELWGLHNTGQVVDGTSGTADADIDAPEAWDITTGDSSVVIAVIDSGVAYNHPELAANIWTNPGEIPGNGTDDDHNGYRDDIVGWDFVDNDNDPMDFYGHGTHVAGTIAGVGNNSRGITGVMWSARIMCLRFLDTSGSGTTADAISAINYAAANGARVLNNSWGGGGLSQALGDAIRRSDSAGTVFVAAAGNEGTDNDTTPSYPASFTVDNIISVAATGQSDDLATFSNFGATSVDVGAPGVNTYSTVPAREVVFSDTFDDGDIADWTTGGTPDTWAATDESPPTPPSGTYTLADSPGGSYQLNANNWAASPSVDLSGRVGCQLVYQLELDTEFLFDFLFIEASTDGTHWTNIYGPNTGYTGSTGGTFVEIPDDISAYDGQPALFVRYRVFESNGSGTGGGVHLDDVRITCASSDYSADTQYEYFEGTSMATPHVSGLAGLIMAAFPGISNTEVKSRILNGSDPVASLDGKTLTGGRINALNSLSIPSPPSGLTALGVSTDQVDLSWTDQSGPPLSPWAEELEFRVYRKTETHGTYLLLGTVPQFAGSGSAVPFPDNTVARGRMYFYRVTASNAAGESSFTNEVSVIVPGWAFGITGGSGGTGNCFIATAAFGSPHARAIDFLRMFRDRYLMEHSIGRKWVAAYYRYSPSVAGLIANYPAIKKGVRLGLLPFVAFSAGTAETTALHKGLIFSLVSGLLTGMALLMKRREVRKVGTSIDPS